MELSSKQRAYLRSLSNEPRRDRPHRQGRHRRQPRQAGETTQAGSACSSSAACSKTACLTAREACDELSALTRSEQVQVIGTKFVLYRPSHKKDKKDKIVLATVKGDIHDIGKNIVKVLLENYSYDVLDLGKDVAPEAIVEETIKNHVRLVGLSA